MAKVISFGNMRFRCHPTNVMILVVIFGAFSLFTYSTRREKKLMRSPQDGVIPFVVTLCLGKS